MNIQIICVGKLKERYWTEAVVEYIKRLKKYCTIEITEIKEEKLLENASVAEEEEGKRQEGHRILKDVRTNSYVIALDIQGTMLSSEALAQKMLDFQLQGRSNIDFIIGGSNGLSREVLKNSDLRLSFSKLTYPHQMMRVILLEQIYRCFKIIKNEPYHK